MKTTDTRWVSQNRITAHAVNEEATGWARTDRAGVLVFWCGQVSNECLVSSGIKKHCKTCEKICG